MDERGDGRMDEGMECWRDRGFCMDGGMKDGM